MYVRELHVRYRVRRISGRRPAPCINGPAPAAAYFGPILQHEAIEVCGLLCLSTSSHVLAYYELSRGSLDHTPLHPRDVFRTALLTNARRVVVAHNHPSGDPTPSETDLKITGQLIAAGVIMGIEIVDHLVLAAPGLYISIREYLRSGQTAPVPTWTDATY